MKGTIHQVGIIAKGMVPFIYILLYGIFHFLMIP